MRAEQSAKTQSSGVVVAIRGSVVDIRFDGPLPPIYSILRTGADKEIVIEVLAQRDARHVRGIALTPTHGLTRGMAVANTGGPLKAPVGKSILSRMFDVFGNVIDREPPLVDVEWRSVHRDPPPLARRSTKSEIFETGHQGHRRSDAAGARRQGGPVRRRGCGQNGTADRNDPQHGRAS